VRSSTLLAAAAILGFVGFKSRSLFIAASVTMAWAATFEIIYVGIGTIGFGWSPTTFVWVTAALAGWVVLANLLDVRPDLRLIAAFIVLLAAWIVFGFHANVAGVGTFNWRDEALNELTKTALAGAFAIGGAKVDRTFPFVGGGTSMLRRLLRNYQPDPRR
jgi:hypothetical protein